MNTRDKHNLTEGVVWKNLIFFFLPIAAGTWFQQLYNAVDAVIVGKFVGTQALAAVGGSAAQISGFLVSVFVTLAGGASVVVAQLYGAGRMKDVKRAAGCAIAFSVLLGAVLTVLFEFLAVPVLHLLGTPEDTIPDSALYLHYYFAATIVILVNNVESGILRAAGDSRRPFIYMLISCAANILLDLVFVLVFGMGVAGVAIATVLSQILNMVLAGIRLFSGNVAFRVEPGDVRIEPGILRSILHIGIPSALQGGMYSISNIILQTSVNSLGTVVVASWALAGKVDGFYWATSSAAGLAITTFVGQNYGAGLMDRVDETLKVGYKIFLPITLALCVLILGFAPVLLPLFSNDPAVVSTTYTICWYFVPFYCIWTYLELAMGALKGCSVVRVPVIINALAVCLFRVVWVLTVYRLVPTLFVIALCYPISWVLAAIPMGLYYRKWRKDPTPD